MDMGTGTDNGPTMPTVTLQVAEFPCIDEDDIQFRFIVGNNNRALEYENAPDPYDHPRIIDSGWLANNLTSWDIVWGAIYGGHITQIEVQVRRTSDQIVLCTKVFQRNIWILGGSLFECSRDPRLWQYLVTIPNISATHVTMLKAIAKVETATTHFRATADATTFHRRYPVHSADGGFGAFQLTNPVPTRTQIWNWKEHANGAYAVLLQKQANAVSYLNAHPPYTPLQLKMETLSRYNGGAYHIWNGTSWVRNPDIVCGCTGNPRKGKLISNPQSECKVRGVCYADYAVTQEYNC